MGTNLESVGTPGNGFFLPLNDVSQKAGRDDKAISKNGRNDSFDLALQKATAKKSETPESQAGKPIREKGDVQVAAEGSESRGDSKAMAGKSEEPVSGEVKSKGKYDLVDKKDGEDGDDDDVLKLDSPKIGNKEPFFPIIPMPFHPQSVPLDLATAEDPSLQGAKPLAYFDQVTQEWKSLKGAPDGSSPGDMGLMKASYDEMVVNYPIQQIANEALDDETRAALQAQGIIDAPVVLAVPSRKLLPVVETIEGAQAVAEQSELRAKHIAQFMASLESELGISPDRLVAAMQALTPLEKQMPPDVTLKQVVKNLKLEPKDEKLAMDLYAKFLGKVNSQGQDHAVMAQPISTAKGELKGERAIAADLNRDLPREKPLSYNDVQPHASQGKVAMTPEGIANSPEGKALKVDVQTVSQNQSQGQVLDAEPLNVKKVQANVKTKALGMDEALSKGSSSDGAGSIDQSQILKTDVLSHAKEKAAPATIDQNQKIENMEAIVKQTQILAEKGGGEMRMILEPKGLGEISLKVSMEDGKVNVQMTTENSEVKKLIETHSHELKHAMGQHNLSMEKLDVSVSQKFADGFRDSNPENFNFRESFQQQGHQNGRPQFQQSKDEVLPLASMMSSRSKTSPYSRMGNSSGKLNLVA